MNSIEKNKDIEPEKEIVEGALISGNTLTWNPVRNKKNKKKIIRNKEKPIQKYRFIIQCAFALLCVWIGIEFFLFTRYLQSNGAALYFQRPPGVDGFLPISSLMSFYLFITICCLHFGF